MLGPEAPRPSRLSATPQCFFYKSDTAPTVDDDEAASHAATRRRRVRLVSRCSAVPILFNKDRQFEIDALRSTKPVKTSKSVSDVI